MHWSIAFALVLAPLLARASNELPKCPPDWQIEVIAAAPEIRHPSVVCTAPNGRVFAAEDPMDISLPAHTNAGRIVCFHPDGKKTVFAEKLYAVFGMQYLEGKLYVLHNPKFTVFEDRAGVGTNRVDLIESTHPNPWALDWNDHVPANFKLAMDGYFYIAVGDKGMYRAKGRDGSEVSLHGGGIVRMRPDGTELEIFSTGVRNILDVALNEEDEIFTYDNTDEHNWMGRLTHMVEGGFYGYPYDFVPRRPYTLWMMADYGGGAATGTLCYNEDALPKEYHGNLFLADFGKRQILRVRVEREGATYKAVSREDFFTDPPADFRPVGIALSHDGKSIYICDWNHRDTKENVVVGRLLKMTYTGKTHETPKPTWFPSVASGEKVSVPGAQLLEALSHPSHSVRLAAQRQLVRQKESGLLHSALNGATNVISRIHALWGLDADKEQVRADRDSILGLLKEPDPRLRRQALRQLGTRRVHDQAIRNALQHSDSSVQFQAAVACGRAGDIAAIPALMETLRSPDSWTFYAAFHALHQIGEANPQAWKQIADGLFDSHARVREGTMFAMRNVYSPELARLLSNILSDQKMPQSASAAESATHILAEMVHQPATWKGEWGAYHPALAKAPVKAQTWQSTSPIIDILSKALRHESSAVKLLALKGLRNAKAISSAPAIAELYKSATASNLRALALETLAEIKAPQASALVLAAMEDPPLTTTALRSAKYIPETNIVSALVDHVSKRNDETTVAAIESLAEIRSSAALHVLTEQLTHTNTEIRTAAFKAVQQISPETALPRFKELLKHPSTDVRRNAVTALGSQKKKQFTPELLAAYDDPPIRDAAIQALAAQPDIRALQAYLAGLTHENLTVRDGCRKAIQALKNKALPLLQEQLTSLSPEVVRELATIYQDNPKARELFAGAGGHDPEDYLEFGLRAPGNSANGRNVFLDLKTTACVKCHAIAPEGGRIGPDLTTIGAQFSRRELAESILYPSKAVREGYQGVNVELKDGESLFGLVKAENDRELTLMDSEGKLHTILKEKIESRRASELSLMPEGLHAGISREAFADLLSFLQGLKEQRSAP